MNMHYTVVVIGSIIAYLNFEKHHEEIAEETLENSIIL